VVEDLSADYIISADEIKGKCALILLHVEEDPNFVSYSCLDPSKTFICRFSLKKSRLIPVLELYNSSLVNMPKSAKRRIQSESTPTSYIDNFKNENTENQNIFSPPERNSVRRNLNKSFGSSPQDSRKSILEYSIVNSSGDEESDIPTVVKIRISRKSSLTDCISPKVRKSRRNLPRISYADYVSPKKRTPTKRNKDSTSDDEFAPSHKLSFTPEKMNSVQRSKMSISSEDEPVTRSTRGNKNDTKKDGLRKR
ncbi:unnamed protein product, partial [Callosobruchus maculatus]